MTAFSLKAKCRYKKLPVVIQVDQTRQTWSFDVQSGSLSKAATPSENELIIYESNSRVSRSVDGTPRAL